MKKIKELLKNNEMKKNIVLVVLVGVILISLGILLYSIISGSKKVTELEKIKITEVSNEITNYLEYVEESKSKDIDKYIIFALEYSSDKYNKNTLGLNEIKKIIESMFSVKVDKDKLINVGISQSMVEKNITYDYEKEEYSLNKIDKSYADIAATKIVKYEIKEIKKSKKNTYKIVYEKYVVENPYEILNYYMDKNKDKDIKVINNYLKGKESVIAIKKYINKNIGKKEKEIEVIYNIRNNNLVIDNIKI